MSTSSTMFYHVHGDEPVAVGPVSENDRDSADLRIDLGGIGDNLHVFVPRDLAKTLAIKILVFIGEGMPS